MWQKLWLVDGTNGQQRRGIDLEAKGGGGPTDTRKGSFLASSPACDSNKLGVFEVPFD